MVRSPAGRLHCRSREEFLLDLERIEVELRSEGSTERRLDFDAVLARAGYFTTSSGDFIELG